MYKGKNILVAGGTGMVGIQLVNLLVEQGANIRIASLDHHSRAHPKAEFMQRDMTVMQNCLDACDGMDYVFNLLGVKGSPAVSTSKPASFFFPTISFSLNLMEAAFRKSVQKYLYTSSIGVYAKSEVFHEDDVWKTYPSDNDRFPGWAKRICELQAETYAIQHGWDQVVIVRPANVYGPYDNFDSENAMVVPSLIRKAMSGMNPMEVWGDGSAIRDLIHARDVARGMLIAFENGMGGVFNLGSGKGVTIKELVEAVVKCMDEPPEIAWDITKPVGDPKKIMDMSRARSIGFEPEISIQDGIRETAQWYQENKDTTDLRYDIFKEAN
ncbi:MAG: NAD-dependent epimerase/dehydratase family protein [Candidatus Hinthialibacter antarcticus]|nr:NAD-dependent epimerase/dehydratase family protein [Candidatus Hinthialibacter antarcticus]